MSDVQHSCDEDDKDDEENDEDAEDFYHEPPVGGDRLKVLDQFPVSRVYVHLGLLYVRVDPAIDKIKLQSNEIKNIIECNWKHAK